MKKQQIINTLCNEYKNQHKNYVKHLKKQTTAENESCQKRHNILTREYLHASDVLDTILNQLGYDVQGNKLNC